MGSDAIRAAWKAAIFDSATIQAITSKAYQFDLLANVASISEDAMMFHNQKINFFTYTTSRRSETGSIRGTNTSAARYQYSVRVDYHLFKDVSEPDFNFNTSIDRLEALDDLVLSELGKTWNSTVDYYELSEFRPPSLRTLEEREFWTVGYTYTGIKTI